MIHDIITNKWIIGAIALLIFFTVAFVLLIRSDTAINKQLEREAAESAEMLHQWEATQKAEQAAATLVESETPTAEKTTTNPDTLSEETEDVRVSPYGLGPYPKVPKEWKFPDLWAHVKSKNEELLERVHIKAWNEGKRYSSIGMEEDGLITAVERGTVIVQWETAPDGTKRICRALSDPKDLPQGIYTRLSDFPSHLNVVNREDVAIDPYEYLGMER